jgi:outer membrane protein insertion porin family
MRTYLRSTLFSLLLLATALVAAPARAQQVAATVDEPRKYTLGGITVSGARALDPNTLIGLSGLRIGDPISIPGEELGRRVGKHRPYGRR